MPLYLCWVTYVVDVEATSVEEAEKLAQQEAHGMPDEVLCEEAWEAREP